jgi:hypothetical protein
LLARARSTQNRILEQPIREVGLAQMIAAVLFVVWEPLWLEAVHRAALALPGNAPRLFVETLFWLGRELVWWWLITGLAAIVLCHLRQLPLTVATGATLARFGPPRRRQLPG